MKGQQSRQGCSLKEGGLVGRFSPPHTGPPLPRRGCAHRHARTHTHVSTHTCMSTHRLTHMQQLASAQAVTWERKGALEPLCLPLP